MNKLKRLLFPIATVAARNDGDYLKVTSCSKIFTVGSLRRIHGKITTLPAGRGTAGRARGSFKVERSEWKESGPSSLLWIHGKRQCCPAFTLTEIDGLPFS